MSLQAYERAQNTTQSPKQVEYRLFGQVTGALIDAKDGGERDKVFFEAIDWNRRLWSTLSTDCGARGNKLPDQLRAQIVSLAIWVGKYSSKVALGRGDIQDLIDVNKTIMEGLAPQSAFAQEQAPAPA